MTTADVSRLTRAQLLAAIKKADKAHFAVVDEMIDGGRGHETGLDIRKKSDALSLRWIETIALCSKLGAERQRRIDAHGTEHRIVERT